MNRREAREQLMNSDSSSAGEPTTTTPTSTSNGNSGSPNKKRQTTPKHPKQQHSQRGDLSQKLVLAETVALDMADSNGDAGDSRNLSSSNLKKLSGDLEKMTAGHSSESLSSASSSNSTCAKALKCLLIFFLMSIVIVLAAILVAIFKFDILDKEDLCFIANQPFQANQYKLFTTKTSYKTAFDLIDKSLANGDAPSVFSSKFKTLKSINDHLTSQNCQVRQLHYYGRHAARFPDREDIEKLERVLNSVRDRIDLSKFSSTTAQLDPSTNQTESSTPSDSITIIGDNNNTSPTPEAEGKVCLDPMSQYKLWRSSMHPDQDNLITDSGFNETEAIATRLKEIFPHMFDGTSSQIKIQTTEALRTGQTAIPFIKHLTNYQFSASCPAADSFPSSNLSSFASVKGIRSSKCLDDLMKDTLWADLESHKKCEVLGDNDYIVGPELQMKSVLVNIAKSISKKLRLSTDLTTAEVDEMYKACEYETSLLGSSIWCNLFSEDNLKYFEYYDDVEDFYKVAYGDNDQASSACLLTSDLMNKFDSATIDKRAQTYLHFSHSQMIRKMLAASFDLDADVAYRKTVAANHLRQGTVPERRNWRSSLFSPFSANLLFTLYDCNPAPSTTDGYLDFDAAGDPLRVVVSLNEHPVRMQGCNHEVCGLGAFRKSRFAGMKGHGNECDLNKICKKRYKMKPVT